MMAQRTPFRKTGRSRNLFGFGRRKRSASSVKSKMTIPQMALSAATMGEHYGQSAGGSSASVEASHMRQQFDDWLHGSGLDTHGSGVRARLRKTFDTAYKRAAKKNPCAQTRKTKVSDRAKRYRANQPNCRPSGVKKCKLCGSRSDVMVDHADGNESNGRKSNLRWLCRSCNNTLGAEMARTGQGRRTVQYNPAHKGAQTLGEYMQAVLQHTRGSHDAAGKIIHETPKRKRQEFASEIWARRESHGTARPGLAEPDWVTNPAASAAQYRLAQAVLSGTARKTRMSKKVAREIVDRTPARLRSEYSRNPEGSTEYRLGYNLGQMDRQNAALRKTDDELTATCKSQFPNWQSIGPFISGYDDGYGGFQANDIYPRRGWPNPEPSDAEPDSDDYRQAKKIAELFHGRPVKETITVTEQIREHDWLWRIGPLVNLKVRTLTKQNATFPFHQDEENMVHLFCSPDGRQFYLRGGDQEIDLKALGMGPGTDWFRDQMLIGEAKEITYRDKKKFHRFALTEYFHKLGEVSNEKPMLAYDALAKKLSILGGQYRIETEDLVDGMSPGIVN